MTQFTSSRDMLQQIAYARLSTDKTDEKMASGILGSIAESTQTNIADSSTKMSVGLAQTLQVLTDMGFDKDDDIVKNLISTNTSLQNSLVKLSEAVVRTVS